MRLLTNIEKYQEHPVFIVTHPLLYMAEAAAAAHLKAWGLCLRCALVEVGHGLPVQIHPGVVVRTGGLLRSRTSWLT